MSNIGRVYRDSFVKDGKKFPILVLDIRTISIRKKFSISVNKNKYEDGNVLSQPVAGKEEYPDYHIWHNFSNRGESLPSQIVGDIRNAVSDSGLDYKKAKLFDPFISDKNIYFTIFAVDDDKKIDENHLYNVVAKPYRPSAITQSGDYSQPAQSHYTNSTQSAQTYKKQDGEDIPVIVESVNEDEIPF